MNYRQLQQTLKEYRKLGQTQIKLNQKAHILQAELERILSLSQPQIPCLTYGVEIEFTSRHSRAMIAEKLKAAGINAKDESYSHRTVSYWKVITDSSCGLEVVSPILNGATGLQELKTVLDTLDSIGCTVNRNCGIHVHVGAQNLGVEKVKAIAKRWVANENNLDTIQPLSRRGDTNTYCEGSRFAIGWNRLDAARTLDEIGYCQWNRYHKLNLTALLRHETIEFRHHAGSLNAEKVCNWVKFLLSFCEETTTGNAFNAGFDALFTSPELLDYYQMRQRQLAN